MKTLYALGIFFASFILIQLETMLIIFLYALFWYLGLEFLGQLVCIVSGSIILIGHGLTTYRAVQHIDNSEVDISKSLEELYKKNTFFNHPIHLGVFWRFKNEWKNIKKVANLDFKNQQSSV